MKSKHLSIITGFFVGLLAQPANAVTLRKFFVATQVNPNAQILGGGQAQTWAGPDLIGDNVILFNTTPPIQRGYQHALTRTDKQVINLNLGLPVGNTGQTAAQGWFPNVIRAKDMHNLPNQASVAIAVNKLQPTFTLSYFDPKLQLTVIQQVVTNAVQVSLETIAQAATPNDGDIWHSADAFAGVEINAGQIFQENGLNKPWTIFGQNQMFVGANSCLNNPPVKPICPKIQDPYYVTVNDIDTGESTTQEVMLQEAEAQNGSVLQDNSGLSLTIDSSNPDAFAKLTFTTDYSWVVNPYNYTIILDKNGLSLSGIGNDRFPLANWQITSINNTIKAFYDFGTDGFVFESVEVLPPQSLFTIGHNYSYDAGSGGGVYDLATAPEPTSTLSLLALGTLGIASTLKRHLKPKPEKETTQVG